MPAPQQQGRAPPVLGGELEQSAGDVMLQAGKRAVAGRYVFDVMFSLPLIGRVLAYSGVLDLQVGENTALH